MPIQTADPRMSPQALPVRLFRQPTTEIKHSASPKTKANSPELIGLPCCCVPWGLGCPPVWPKAKEHPALNASVDGSGLSRELGWPPQEVLQYHRSLHRVEGLLDVREQPKTRPVLGVQKLLRSPQTREDLTSREAAPLTPRSVVGEHSTSKQQASKQLKDALHQRQRPKSVTELDLKLLWKKTHKTEVVISRQRERALKHLVQVIQEKLNTIRRLHECVCKFRRNPTATRGRVTIQKPLAVLLQFRFAEVMLFRFGGPLYIRRSAAQSSSSSCDAQASTPLKCCSRLRLPPSSLQTQQTKG